MCFAGTTLTWKIIVLSSGFYANEIKADRESKTDSSTEIQITHPILDNGNGFQNNEVIVIHEWHYNNVAKVLCLLLQLFIYLIFSILWSVFILEFVHESISVWP
jgi:hypothetical protein